MRWLACLLVLLGTCPALGADFETVWSGQLATTGMLTQPARGSVQAEEGLDADLDGSLSGRIMNRTIWNEQVVTDLAYEVVLTGGEKRLRWSRLGKQYPWLAVSDRPDDGTRLLDMTSEFVTDDGLRGYHRIDRAMLELRGTMARLRLGRQALTWGNGLVFNPLDLFNPFSPVDVIRDYKLGEDMAVVNFSLSESEVELVAVPRRESGGGGVRGKASSVGARWHFFAGGVEADVLAALHREDAVLGLGLRGTVGDAAWRTDLRWTRLTDAEREQAVDMVLSLDRSWVWAGRNWYGLLEYYHQGLSANSLPATGQALLRRLDNGETYVLGRDYVAVKLDVEVHPLVHVGGLALVNLHDPSGLIQPMLTWSVTANTDFLLIGTVCTGRDGTEYGGYSLPTGQVVRPDSSLVGRLSWYF